MIPSRPAAASSAPASSPSAAELIAWARTEGRNLLEPEAYQLLTSYGIPVPPHRWVRTPEEAAAAATQLGFPVALKVVSPDVLHKSDVGGVVLNLTTPADVKDAFPRVETAVKQACPQARLDGILISRQEPPGTEVVVGTIRDPQFGPAVMFGLGGIFIEILHDVSFRLAPVTPDDAEEMMREIRTFPILAGSRGRPAADLRALRDLICAVSQLAVDLPAVSEMDLNPVIVRPTGLTVVDARIMLRPD